MRYRRPHGRRRFLIDSHFTPVHFLSTSCPLPSWGGRFSMKPAFTAYLVARCLWLEGAKTRLGHRDIVKPVQAHRHLFSFVTLGLVPSVLAQTPVGVPPPVRPAAPAASPASVVSPASAVGKTNPAAPVVNGAAANPTAEQPIKKPRKFWIGGKFRELKKGEVRPYTPPNLLPEPAFTPSAIQVIEIAKPDEGDPQVLARPYYGAPMLGTVAPGTRIAVRGEVLTKSTRYCPSKRWLAVEPFGWLCQDAGKATTAPPTTEPIYKIVPGERVPHRYIMVSALELPLWPTLEAWKAQEEPERKLAKGDSVAVEKTFKHDGESFWQTVEGKILPVKGTYQMSATSTWHGVMIDEKMHLPFGWVLPENLKAQAAPDLPAAVMQLPRRTRVDVLEETTVKGKRWLRVRNSAPPSKAFPLGTEPLPQVEVPAAATPSAKAAATPAAAPAALGATPGVAATAQAATPGGPNGAAGATALPAAGSAPVTPVALPEPTLWVPAWAVNEVRKIAKPPGIGPNPQWFDADLSEQVLVAYENDQPVFATLVSSGKNNATPLGIYPVWARVAAITMKSQPYDDKPYFVNMVPWSTFFQAHNAIHGAYWHNRFGSVKSHGCINVSPLDARFVFERLRPGMPAGWTSVRPTDVTQWPMLYIHDSGRRPAFRQDRPMGPPDRQDETDRFEETNRLRAEQGLPPLPPPGQKPPEPPGTQPGTPPPPGTQQPPGTPPPPNTQAPVNASPPKTAPPPPNPTSTRPPAARPMTQ